MRRGAGLPEQTMDPFNIGLPQFAPNHGQKPHWVESASHINLRKRPREDAINESLLSDTQFSVLNEAALILNVPTAALLGLSARSQRETKPPSKRQRHSSPAMVKHSNYVEPLVEGILAPSKVAVPKDCPINNPSSMPDARGTSSCRIRFKPIADCFSSFNTPDSNLMSGNEYYYEKPSYPPMPFSEHPGLNQHSTQSMFILNNTGSTHVKPYNLINPLDEPIFDEPNFKFACNEGLRSPDEFPGALSEHVQPSSHLQAMTYPANNNTEDENFISTLYKDLSFSIHDHPLTTATQKEPFNLIDLGDELGQELFRSKDANKLDREELGPARRKPFQSIQDRQQTAETRKLIACIRCRMQRIRCQPDPFNPAECLTCQKLIKPKICHLPCLRYKLTNVRLFREGHFAPGHEWSHRWPSEKMEDITNWASPEVKTIYVTQDYSQTEIKFQVREFVPIEGDMLRRQWADGDTLKFALIPNYAIIDMRAALRAHEEHIAKDGHKYFMSAFKNNDSLLWDTYTMARTYSCNALFLQAQEEMELLRMVLKLWITVRLCVRSQRICGTEVLGMSPNIMDKSSPMHGNIPVPPVLAAQAQFIVTQRLQAPLRNKILDLLQKLTLAQKPAHWFCIYLSTFILLHNCSLLTKHDIGYARKHGLKRKHARPDMINDLHMGANILLAHFHYACKGFNPFSLTWDPKTTTSMAKLNVEQIKFIRQTANHVDSNKSRFKQLLDQTSYEDEHYFIAQLYEVNWKPRSTV